MSVAGRVNNSKFYLSYSYLLHLVAYTVTKCNYDRNNTVSHSWPYIVT